MFRRLRKHPALEPMSPAFKYVTTTRSGYGYFGVVIWCNDYDPDCLFWDHWAKTTDPGEFYATELEAQHQAYWWAWSQSLPFYLPDFVEPEDPTNNLL
jgi:hypothetical protein